MPVAGNLHPALTSPTPVGTDTPRTEADTTALRGAINQLWRDLGGNPRNRALVVARVSANHGDDTVRSWVADQISAHTPPGQERSRALALLKAIPSPFPQLKAPETAPEEPTAPHSPPDTSHVPTLRTDPELGRLAIGLHQAAGFRLWTVGRQLTREGDGSGKLTQKALRAALRHSGVDYTTTHLKRLLHAGEGLFWNVSEQDKRVYVRSWVYVSGQLTTRALATNPALVDTNRPGVRQMYLSPAGGLEQWEAELYKGWLAYRNNPTIARDTLEVLFNRSADTLRRWETHHLEDDLDKRTNYAQNPDHERYPIPEHAFAYVANVRWNGTKHTVVRERWRLPNTYQAGVVREHPHKGQAKKVRTRVNHLLNQPVDNRRDGLPWLKRYFDTTEGLRRFVKRHDLALGYLWRGENRRGHGMFEPNNTGFGMTRCNERADYKTENLHLAAIEGQVRLYMSSRRG